MWAPQDSPLPRYSITRYPRSGRFLSIPNISLLLNSRTQVETALKLYGAWLLSCTADTAILPSACVRPLCSGLFSAFCPEDQAVL